MLPEVVFARPFVAPLLKFVIEMLAPGLVLLYTVMVTGGMMIVARAAPPLSMRGARRSRCRATPGRIETRSRNNGVKACGEVTSISYRPCRSCAERFCE